MKKLVFIFLLALGSAWNCHAQGWTFIQDNITTGCSATASSCTIALGNGNMIPTTAGTVWVAIVSTGNNVTISSVTGGGGAWTACATCHIFMASPARNIDAWYNLTGSAGTSSITVNLSGASSALLKVDFIELMPPAGSTASFDAGGATSSPNCVTCTGVGLNLTATDAVVEFQGIHDPNGWDAWSSPWTTNFEGNGIYLDAPSGSMPAPTVVMANSQAGGIINALAFKSTKGVFTPKTPSISTVSYTNPQSVNCSPACSLSIPSTGSGHLLYLEAANQSSVFIASVSGGGSWQVPQGCQVRGASPAHGISCAYVLSSTSGTSSINVTMAGTSNNYFAVWEMASTGGAFALDGSPATATNSPSLTPAGVTLSLSGANDVVFQAIDVPGGTSGNTLYPGPFNTGNGAQFWVGQAAAVTMLNTTSGAAPRYANEQNNTTIVSGIAFKTGTAAGTNPPAAPTGLTAVVN